MLMLKLGQHHCDRREKLKKNLPLILLAIFFKEMSKVCITKDSIVEKCSKELSIWFCLDKNQIYTLANNLDDVNLVTWLMSPNLLSKFDLKELDFS